MSEPVYHEPVLTKEVLDTLNPAPGQYIIDATTGQGGHSLAILIRMGFEGLLVGIDRDALILEAARQRFESAHVPQGCYRLVAANFANLPDAIPTTLPDAHVTAPDGLLFDLGPSNAQLLEPARGLSWTSDSSLDMRLNPQEGGPTAADLVNTLSAEELTAVFRDLADERWAKRIAGRIVRERTAQAIGAGRQLGELVSRAIPRRNWPPKTHPATRVFLALRIRVNEEYRALEQVLPIAFEMLKPGGRLVVISFHSGEHRRVRRFMREMARPPQPPWPQPQGEAKAPGRLLTRKPISPGPEEIQRNPRSRSARLWALEKLAGEEDR